MDSLREHLILLVFSLCLVGPKLICAPSESYQHTLANFESIDSLIQKAHNCRLTDCDSSILYLNKALILAKSVNYKKGVVDCYNELGVDYRGKGHLDSAERFFNRAVKLSNNIRYKEGLGTAFLRLGSITKRQGDYERARMLFLRSIAVFTSIDRYDRLCSAYNNLGLLYKRTGEIERSMEYLVRSVNYCQAGAGNDMLMRIYNNIAGLFSRAGDYDNAIKYYHKAFLIADEINHEIARTGIRVNLGIAHYNRNVDSALYYFTRVQSSRLKSKDRDPYIVHSHLSKIYLSKRDTARAILCSNKAIEYSSGTNDLSMAFEDRAKLYLNIGYTDTALVYFQKGLELLNQQNPDELEVSALIRKARIYLKLDFGQECRQILEQALNLEKISDHEKLECYTLLTKVYQKSGELTKAEHISNLRKESSKILAQKFAVLRTSVKNLEQCCIQSPTNNMQLAGITQPKQRNLKWPYVLAAIIVVLAVLTYLTKRKESSLSIAVLTEDEKLLQHAFKIVEIQGSDSSFDVGHFVKEIGISRSHLHRRLKDLTGMSAGEFIRDYRLNAAYELLKKGRKNIAQVAYDCGFSSPSYFTECFKKKYGKVPSDVRRPQSKSSYKHLFFSSLMIHPFK